MKPNSPCNTCHHWADRSDGNFDTECVECRHWYPSLYKRAASLNAQPSNNEAPADQI